MPAGLIKGLAHDIARLYAFWKMRRDPIAYARSLGVHIGDDCQLLGLAPFTFGSEPYLIWIGNRVLVTAGVRFITHDGGVSVFRKEEPDIDVIAPITVGNNGFIGTNAIILAGVNIGDDCVIGAGSVVTRDVPSGCVVAGVPARRVKSLNEYRAKLGFRNLKTGSLSESDKRQF